MRNFSKLVDGLREIENAGQAHCSSVFSRMGLPRVAFQVHFRKKPNAPSHVDNTKSINPPNRLLR